MECLLISLLVLEFCNSDQRKLNGRCELLAGSFSVCGVLEAGRSKEDPRWLEVQAGQSPSVSPNIATLG